MYRTTKSCSWLRIILLHGVCLLEFFGFSITQICSWGSIYSRDKKDTYAYNINYVCMSMGSLWERKSCIKSPACPLKPELKINLLRRFRYFQRSTVATSGYKVTSCQSWWFEKNSEARLEMNHTLAAWVRLSDDGTILKVWRTLTLQPFDL